MRPHHRFITLLLLMFIALFSCRKNEHSPTANGIFYGKWKASYGDTIEFTRENGKDILIYDNSMNPTFPATTRKQYQYQLGKLALKEPGWSLDGYHQLQSFAWVRTNESFTIQGVEWFTFMSSTQTYFTFTKIP